MATNQSLKKQMSTAAAKTAAPAPQTIQGWVKKYENQIAKALPSVLTPERFSRMVLTAITKTPRLAACRPESFIGAMLTAAQLGLEPNTPLGQAYLIPYKDECQFQIGYKGLLDLAYRSGEFQCIMSEIVYENDAFSFEYGLSAALSHKPTMGERGEMKWVYAMYKLKNGGYSFVVKSIDDIVRFAKKYSKTYGNGPWQTAFEEMAKKTVIKQLLKYAPLKSEFARGVYADGTVNIADMSGESAAVITASEFEVGDYEDENAAQTEARAERTAKYDVDLDTGELKDLKGTPFEEVEEIR